MRSSLIGQWLYRGRTYTIIATVLFMAVPVYAQPRPAILAQPWTVTLAQPCDKAIETRTFPSFDTLGDSDLRIVGARGHVLVTGGSPNVMVGNDRLDVVRIELKSCSTANVLVRVELASGQHYSGKFDPGSYSLTMSSAQAIDTIRFVIASETEAHEYYAVRNLTSAILASPSTDTLGRDKNLFEQFFGVAGASPGKPAVEIPLGASLPPIQAPLSGRNEIRIRNPNSYSVKVQLRTGTFASNFNVPPGGVASGHGPDGKYEIFFIHSNEPESLYQGDDFTVSSGNGVEITLTAVIGGNYGVRKIR